MSRYPLVLVFWLYHFQAAGAAPPAVPSPVIGFFSTFSDQLGTSIQSMALDAAGNVYIAGTTTAKIPLVNPIQASLGSSNCSPEPSRSYSPCEDVFVAKFDPTGSKLLYSTYLGTTQRNFAAAIAVDSAGNAYVAGTARPPGFANYPRDGQAFVYKLNPTGSAILYSRYINGDTQAASLAVDAQGNAYLTGASLAVDFPAVNALQSQAPIRSLFVSDDSGVTWRSLNNGLAALTVYSLAVVPARGDPNSLFAATSSGLFKSSDAGASWMRIFPAVTLARQVLVDPLNPATVYVLSADAGGSITHIAKSIDSGATWTDLTANLPPPRISQLQSLGAMAIDPSNPSVLWLTGISASSPAVLKSVDGGAHWQDMHDFPAFFVSPGGSLNPDPDASGILLDPTNSSRLYLCCDYTLGSSLSAIFRSDDSGSTWTAGGSGPSTGTSGIWPPVLDPRRPSTLYAAWPNGAVRSTDAGQTWMTLNIPPSYGYESGSLALDPSGVLYIVNTGLLLRSADGGDTWTTLPGPWGPHARLLTIDPTHPSTLYVGSPGAGGSAGTFEHAFAARLDPSGSILWSTLLAGSQQDEGRAITVDQAGNAYVAGRTNSTDFPLATPLQSQRGKAAAAGFDAFVAKVSADGSRLLYSTHLGESGDDAANAIAVDSAGNTYVGGSTHFADFPTVNAFQPKPGSALGSSFIAKIDPTGQKLLYSTYLGGGIDWPFNDAANTIAVDAQGAAWVGGLTGTVDFPLVQPVQPSLRPGGGGYLTRLAPTGNALQFSTHFSGPIAALALAPSGSVWMAGSSQYMAGATIARLDLAPAPAQPGVPSIYAVYNAAGFQLGDTVSPGEIISLLGAELAPAAQAAAAYPLPLTLQDVSVTIGGMTTPLFYVSPGQINLQVPPELPLGTASLLVRRTGQSSASRSMSVVGATAGIFTVDGTAGTPVVVHAADFSLVTAGHPAHAGEYLALFCSGLGATNPGVSAGAAASAMPVPIQAKLEVVVDSRVVPDTQYAGLAPGFAGLYQVNFRLLPDEQPGTKVLYLYPGNGLSSNAVYFPMQ